MLVNIKILHKILAHQMQKPLLLSREIFQENTKMVQQMQINTCKIKVTISIERKFEKTQHLFMIKILNNSGIEGSYST